MPPRKSIPSLEELCWKTIVCSFQHLKREAQNLPTFFIDKLYKRLNKDRPCISLPLDLFLHPDATELLKFPPQMPLSETKLVKKISRDCKNLRRIVLPSYFGWTPLESIFVNKPLLIHLDLYGTDQITDHNLHQISKHCPQLQYLNLKCVEEITNSCMNYLPTTLTFLNVKHTGITPSGCLIALNRLRSLKELKHDRWIDILVLLKRQQQKSTFSIECLKIYEEFGRNINLGRIVVDMFPKLHDLRLIIHDIQNIISLRESQMLSLITHLNVHSCFQNVFLIGKLCPMLAKLVVWLSRFDRSIINDAMLDTVGYVPFKQLRTLQLCLNWNYDYRLADLKILLENAKWLKSLILSKWRQLEDEIIYDLLESNLLKGIENIEFHTCVPFTKAALIQILRFTDSLKFMKIYYCEKILNDEITILQKLIQDENWDVSLSHQPTYDDNDDDLSDYYIY